MRTLAAAVKPGGWLVIQDLVARPGLRGLPLNALALAAQWARLLAGSRPQSTAVARLYERHGAGETYLRPDEAERAYAELLPGSRVTHSLEWRYTAVWRRPES